MGDNFTIPVVVDTTAIMAKLEEILNATLVNHESLEELKKIRLGTGLAISEDLNEAVE